MTQRELFAAPQTPSQSPREQASGEHMESGARFSPCRKYRYSLWRIWDRSLPSCAFIGLNPSTADETENDPTIRKCIGFAKRWGHGSLYMLNVFAFRSTDPKGMPSPMEAVGPDNLHNIHELAIEAAMVVASWGKHKAANQSALSLRQRLGVTLHCLKRNQDGSPMHPLYVPYEVTPEVWYAPTTVNTGEQRKREGMARAADSKPAALGYARECARQIAQGVLEGADDRMRTDGCCTADDIARVFERENRPSLGNASGVVFQTPSWRFTGDRVKSVRPHAHANELKTWRLIL